MKRFASILLFLCLLFPTAIKAQQQQICRFRDATNKTRLVNTRQFDLTFPTTRIGLHTLSTGYFYDGANLRRWLGAQVNTDDIASTTYMPYVANFSHLWDTVNDNWDRMTGMEIKLSVKDMMALLTYSANMFLVGDTWYDWTGAQMNSDAVVATTRAPYVGSFGMAYDNTGAVWQRLNLLGSFADGVATTENGLVTASMNYGYNGTTFDLLRISD